MRRSTDFSSAVRHGRRVRRGTVVVHLATRAATEPTEAGVAPEAALVGFVVGKTVGGSVVRHQVSRRLRAVVADRLAALPPDTATVVRALPSSAEASSTRLASDVDAALAVLVAKFDRGVTP
jgi:ribonuclease P protein component